MDNDQNLNDLNQENEYQESLEDGLSEEVSDAGEQESSNQQQDASAPQEKTLSQSQVGRMLRDERRRVRRQIEAELAQSQGAYQPQNQDSSQPSKVFDPKTNQYYSADSPIGQMIAYNQLAQKREQERKHVEELKTFQDRVERGFVEYGEAFESAKERFIELGTDEMANALMGEDKPDAVIHYLGTNIEELRRISQLSPARQSKKIWEISQRLNPPKKTVSSAPAPTQSMPESGVAATGGKEVSYEERKARWRSKLFT